MRSTIFACRACRCRRRRCCLMPRHCAARPPARTSRRPASSSRRSPPSPRRRPPRSCSAGSRPRRRSRRARSASTRRGCLAGASALPINGETWQVMRLSRNRNWGNGALIDFLERFAAKAAAASPAGPASWSATSRSRAAARCAQGMPRTRSASTPTSGSRRCPARTLRARSGSRCRPSMMVRSDRLDVNGSWTPAHMAVVKLAAQDPRVERIFVNAAIKKAICRDAAGDRSWLAKVRPMYGHDYHFHVRMSCPHGDARLPLAGRAAEGRRLRQGARLLVLGRGPPSKAADEAGQAEAAAVDGRPAAGLPAGPAS